MHDISLITTVAAAFSAAWILGLLTQRLGLSPIVGYLIAGVLIGPHTPGFMGDVQLAQQAAELGVILLMFGVGLHFHLKDLIAVKRIAIPGAIGQSLVATIVAVVVFTYLGVPTKSAAVMGMAMAVASTVVLMRGLTDADRLSSPEGHVAVGWLLVEDVLTVMVLVMIPVFGVRIDAAPDESTAPNLFVALAIMLAKLGILVAVVVWAGSKVVPWVMVRVARLRSRELFTLTVLVFSIAVATGAYILLGASMALAAFLAGMVVGQSQVSHQAAADVLPLRDAFAVLFFVSVGMLFDPSILFREPLMVLAALGIILIAKPLAALAIVAILGHSVRTALTVAIGLGQIGEFSFILSEAARQYSLMPEAGHNVLVAAAIISITLNPLAFRTLEPIEQWLRGRPRLWELLTRAAEKRGRAVNASVAEQLASTTEESEAKRTAVIVGYGPVGRSADQLLREAGLRTIVVDLNSDTVSALVSAGRDAIYGDAANSIILEQAGVKKASQLIVALPHAFQRTGIVAAAKSLNPELCILVRARYLREREELEQAGATGIVFEESEAAAALARLAFIHAGMTGTSGTFGPAAPVHPDFK